MDIKYEGITKIVSHMTKAEGVALIVLNGKDGTGYSILAESGLRELLPTLLRKVATEISQQRGSPAMGEMDAVSHC